MDSERDVQYLSIIVDPIRVCASYTPKMGGKNDKGYTLEQFQSLYQADPFYNWFGLDNALMYAAHKAAGGMTSIYRQIGIGCENLFRQILRDTLELSASDVHWSYQIPSESKKLQTLSLDGRIPLEAVLNAEAKERIYTWIQEKALELHVDPKISASLDGVVLRSGKDTKAKTRNARMLTSEMQVQHMPEHIYQVCWFSQHK